MELTKQEISSEQLEQKTVVEEQKIPVAESMPQVPKQAQKAPFKPSKEERGISLSLILASQLGSILNDCKIVYNNGSIDIKGNQGNIDRIKNLFKIVLGVNSPKAG